MKLRAAVVVVFACITACGESNDTTTRRAPACAADVTIAVVATGEDFSALDPARCPAAVPEDFHGANPGAPLLAPESAIEGKAFYVLALLDEVSDASAAISNWPALAMLAAERMQMVQAAANDCNGDRS